MKYNLSFKVNYDMFQNRINQALLFRGACSGKFVFARFLSVLRVTPLAVVTVDKAL